MSASQYQYLTDIYIYSFSQNTHWVLVSPGNSFNSTNGGSVVHDNLLYYYLGVNYQMQSLSEGSMIYALDLLDPQDWANYPINCSAQSSCLRDSFASALVDGELWIYGGHSYTAEENNLLRVDLATGTATRTYETVYPSPRVGASLAQIADLLILFGGKSKENYFQDLWGYNVTMAKWGQIPAEGVYPGPRSGYAMDTQGRYILYVGGRDSDNSYYSDYWLLDTLTFKWIELIPSSENLDLPTPITETCVILDMPVFYMVGGRTFGNFTLDIWQYNITSAIFTRLYATQDEDIPIFRHGCQLRNNINGQLMLYTFFGSKDDSDDPYCAINAFSFADLDAVELVSVYTPDIPCRTSNAYFAVNDMLLILGGQAYQKISFGDVWEIYVDYGVAVQQDIQLENSLYLSAFAVYGSTLYTYSGFEQYGYSRYADPITKMYGVKFFLGNYPNFCGNGQEYVNKQCQLCLPGQYSGLDDLYCISCPKGTYSSVYGASNLNECIPCPQGTYGDIKGLSSCLPCSGDEICFIGTVTPLPPSYYSYFPVDSQPKIYKLPDDNASLITIAVLFSALITVFLIMYRCSLKLRIFISVHEVFAKRHIPREDLEEKKELNPSEPQSDSLSHLDDQSQISMLGGFCTGIAALALAFEFSIYITVFIQSNIQEDIILVPSASLTQEYQYTDNQLSLAVSFSSYRGTCGAENITITKPNHISIESFGAAYNPSAPFMCEVSLDILSKALFTTGDYVQFGFSSFSSDIYTKLEADPAVPREKSISVQNITSDSNTVFSGSLPSVFFYSVMPALYNEKGYFSTFSRKGFRVLQYLTPTSGVHTSTNNIPLSTGMQVRVELILSQTGIKTVKYYKTDIASFLGGLAGALTGLIAVIGSSIFIIEWIYYMIKGKLGTTRKDSYNRELQIQYQLIENRKIARSKRAVRRQSSFAGMNLEEGINS